MPTVLYHIYTPCSQSVPEVVKQEHELGRRLLSKGLLMLYGIRLPSASPDDCLLKNENGKPFLKDFPDIHFNITHCSGLAACAFHSSPLGVDAEKPGYYASVLEKKALTEDEVLLLSRKGEDKALREEWFFRLWTLKEAYVKMTGTGLDVELKAFSFTFLRDGSVSCSDPSVICFQKQLGTGHILSLCYPAGKDPGKTDPVVFYSADV